MKTEIVAHSNGLGIPALISSAGDRAAIGKTGWLSDAPMSSVDVWRMVQRRVGETGIETEIGRHTFRATGITDYLTNGGRLEIAQHMAGHSNPKTNGPLRPAQR
jgi:integrase